MSEEVRKEFEEWALHNCYILNVNENGDYEKDITFSAHEAWVASREAMKPIKLPTASTVQWSMHKQSRNDAIDECVEATQQSGYKVAE